MSKVNHWRKRMFYLVHHWEITSFRAYSSLFFLLNSFWSLWSIVFQIERGLDITALRNSTRSFVSLLFALTLIVSKCSHYWGATFPESAIDLRVLVLSAVKQMRSQSMYVISAPIQNRITAKIPVCLKCNAKETDVP